MTPRTLFMQNTTINVTFLMGNVSSIMFNYLSGNINLTGTTLTFNATAMMPSAGNSSFGGFIANANAANLVSNYLYILSYITFATNFQFTGMAVGNTTGSNMTFTTFYSYAYATYQGTYIRGIGVFGQVLANSRLNLSNFQNYGY